MVAELLTVLPILRKIWANLLSVLVLEEGLDESKRRVHDSVRHIFVEPQVHSCVANPSGET